MDAFAVSITNGAVTRNVTFGFATKLAASFGLFQAAMPMIGWAVGKAGEGFISKIDHWIALLLLSYIGIQMLREAKKKRNEGIVDCQKEPPGFKTILAFAVATSIDALATGIILPTAVGASTLPLMLASVVSIGMITFLFSLVGVGIGKNLVPFAAAKQKLSVGLFSSGLGLKSFWNIPFFLKKWLLYKRRCFSVLTEKHCLLCCTSRT